MSLLLPNNRILELLYDPEKGHTKFAIWHGGDVSFHDEIVTLGGERLVPYSGRNNLIKRQVVLFPSEPQDYGSVGHLIDEIEEYIHKYVDVSSRFQRLAAYYVLFTWLFDGFAELPYLRLRGDYGNGKTRFLLVVGSLCYKPIFASGATSTSAIFRMLDCFGGTLIVDEGDFRYSDEKSDLIKIFNNGNQKGLPVIKTEMSGTKEFNPRAFDVFAPKILASRGSFDDKALESRFLTEEAGTRPLRKDIPINLPPTYKDEALALRNKLLMYRFRNFRAQQHLNIDLDPRIEPRLRQIFGPLLSVIPDTSTRNELTDLLWEYHRELRADRSLEIEGQLLSIIRDLLSKSTGASISIKQITERFLNLYGQDYERITPKWIGMIVRKRLHLNTQRSGNGPYVISADELPKLKSLYEKYGIEGC